MAEHLVEPLREKTLAIAPPEATAIAVTIKRLLALLAEAGFAECQRLDGSSPDSPASRWWSRWSPAAAPAGIRTSEWIRRVGQDLRVRLFRSGKKSLSTRRTKNTILARSARKPSRPRRAMISPAPAVWHL